MDSTIAKVKVDDMSFEELMLDVRKGNIRIPNFQREFVWEQSQIISLLDSIYHHYPIGSFLLWRTKEEIESFRTIGDINLDTESSTAVHYVLDGQQRITSLFACLEEAEIKVKIKGKTVKKKLEIFFDLDEEEFVADPYAKTRKQKNYKSKRIISYSNQDNYLEFLELLTEKFEELDFEKERTVQWLADTLDKGVSYAKPLFNDCVNWKLFESKSDHYRFGKNKDAIYDDSTVKILKVLATHFAWFEDMFAEFAVTDEITDFEEFTKLIDERTEEALNDPWYMRERLRWLQGLGLGIYGDNDNFKLTDKGILAIQQYQTLCQEERIREEQLEQDRDQRYFSLKDLIGGNVVMMGRSLSESRAQALGKALHSVQKYPFSVIYVVEQPVDIACDIFERINNSGQVLKLVDLMVAKSYSPSFNMRQKMYQFFQELDKEHYGDIPDVTILQCLAAILGKSIKRNDILNLDKSQISDEWDSVMESIRRAIDYLKSDFNLTSSKIIPYNSLLIPLAYFFYFNEDAYASDEARKELQMWFWKASFTSRYDNAVETKMGVDLLEIDKILKGEKPSFEYQTPLIDEERIMNQRLHLGSAFCKTILCLYNQKCPVDFLNNTPVHLNTFSKFNAGELHHIFPQAYLKNHLPEQAEMKDSIVNIAIASASVHKKLYRDKPPAVYMQDCKAKNNDFALALNSHLISDLTSSGLFENDYNQFLSHRAENIINEIQAKIGKLSRIETELQKDEKGVIDEFEARLRALISTKLTSLNPLYWDDLPPDFRDRVEQRVTNWIRTNPARQRDEVNPLDFCQIFDYYKVIKRFWSEFEETFGSKTELEKHFGNISEFRNAMMHSREMNLSTRKLAEGSLIWFDQIFEKNQ